MTTFGAHKTQWNFKTFQILFTACLAAVSAEPQFYPYSGLTAAGPILAAPYYGVRLAHAAAAPVIAHAAPIMAATQIQPYHVLPIAHAVAAPNIAHVAVPQVKTTDQIDLRIPNLGAEDISVVAAPVQPYHGVPVAPPSHSSSQFHKQDEFGNYEYGYSNINSVKHEAGNTYSGVSGSYSYVDANGLTQTTNYVADDLGFRVQATNLPVAPRSARLPVSTMRIWLPQLWYFLSIIPPNDKLGNS